MSRVTILLILIACALTDSPSSLSQSTQQQPINENLTDAERSIKLSITTRGRDLDQPRDRFQFGQEILVTITMTDRSYQPAYACVSSALYQDLPRLTRDGKLMPYAQTLSSDLRNTQTDEACQKINLPQRIQLKPDQPALIDWLTIVDDDASTGAESWYDPLPPGNYELSIQRRLDCCDGPRLESNRVNFEVAR